MQHRLSIAIMCFLLAMLLGVYHELRQEPRIVKASYQDISGGTPRAFSSFPLELGKKRWDKRIDVRIRPLDPRDDLLVGFDDYLMEVSINGVPYQKPSDSIRSQTRNVRIELPDKPTDFYDLGFWIRNDDGPGRIRLRVAPRPAFLVITRTAISLLFLGGLLALFGTRRKTLPLTLVIWMGILLRLLYYWHQSIYEKTNDLGPHLEYLRYLRDTWSIPNVAECWMCFSPPLYYALALTWESIPNLLGYSISESIHTIALLSLFVSIAAFLLSVPIGKKLLCLAEDRELILFALLTGSLPPLVFQSTRITSDGLQYLISALCLYLLILWWRKPTLLVWSLLSVAVSAAVLTKGTGLVLLVAVLLLALAKKSLLIRTRLIHIFLFALIFSAITGWYFQIRFSEESGHWIAGAVDRISAHFHVGNKTQDFVVFNPHQVLKHVYNGPGRDELRRSYHWEFFYRSAYLGEFNWGKMLKSPARIMLATGLVLIFLAALGLIKSLKTRFWEDLPLHVLSAGVLGASLYYRFSYPFCHTSDFRYSLLLVPILSYFAVLGSNSSRPVLRQIGSLLILLHVLCCWLFTLLVCTESS